MLHLKPVARIHVTRMLWSFVSEAANRSSNDKIDTQLLSED